MDFVNAVLDVLSYQKKAAIHGKGYMFDVQLRKTVESVWDISFLVESKYIGYVTMNKVDHGSYTIANDGFTEYDHPGLDDDISTAIQVHPDYQHRGVGSALLSLGITSALRESGNRRFCVSAFTEEQTAAFYEQFGFSVAPANIPGIRPIVEGTYKKKSVADISIKANNG